MDLLAMAGAAAKILETAQKVIEVGSLALEAGKSALPQAQALARLAKGELLSDDERAALRAQEDELRANLQRPV